MDLSQYSINIMMMIAKLLSELVSQIIDKELSRHVPVHACKYMLSASQNLLRLLVASQLIGTRHTFCICY